MTSIECPCCGCDGAESDADGFYWDGQPLICECIGQVSCCSETSPYINTYCDDKKGCRPDTLQTGNAS